MQPDQSAQEEGKRAVRSDPAAINNEKVLLAALLFVLALLIRAAAARSIVFPLDPDDAYYVAVARRLFAGHGLTVNVVWNYLSGVPDSLPVPASDYWGPLVPAVLWGFFALLGESWRAAQLAPGMVGAALVVCVYLLVLRHTKNETFALLAALAMMLNATMVQSSVSPGTAIFYAGLMFPTLVLARRVATGRAGWAVVAGVCGGLLSLARNDGVLALVTLGLLCLIFARDGKRAAFLRLVALGLGFAIVRVPWEAYSSTVSGGPAGSQLRVAFLANYSELFTSHPEKLTLAHLLQQGLAKIIAVRVKMLGASLYEVAVQVGVVPFLLAIGAIVRRRREPVMAGLGLHYLVLFLFSAVVFPYPTQQGTFGHSFTGMAPLVLGAAFIALADLYGTPSAPALRKAPAWVLALAMMAVYVLTLGPSLRRAEETSLSRKQLEQYIALALDRLNPKGRPVLHFDAWDYYYTTMQPALMLPRDDYGSIIALARRFRAPFIVTHSSLFKRQHADFPREWPKDTRIALISEPVWPVQIFYLLYPESVGRELSRIELARAHSRAGISLDRAADTVTDATFRRARREAAAAELRKAALLAPEVPNAHYNLALVLDGLGQTEEAIAEAETALRLRPNDPALPALLQRLRSQPFLSPPAGKSPSGGGARDG